MISSSLKIDLLREKQKFKAGLAILKSELSDLGMHEISLHPEEKKVFNQYTNSKRKTSYLLGRLSSKMAILKLVGNIEPSNIWIDSGIFQFPVVKSSNVQNVQVSITHCDSIGLSIAFSENHPMGIDLEKIVKERVDVVLSQITAKEMNLLDKIGMNNVHGYYNIFSVKESLSKIIRTGMMLDFKYFELDSITINQPIFEASFCHFGQYKALGFIQNGYVFSLALPKRSTIPEDQINNILKSVNGVLNS